MPATSANSVIVRRARAEELIDLRHRVLRGGLPRESAIFEGDDNPRTQHFVAVGPNESIVGCATLVPSDYNAQPSWRLRGMAVDDGWRNKGVGAALLRAIDDFAAALECPAPQLWCNARTPAVPFYQRHGWVVVSDEFHIETAGPHFKMIKTIRAASAATDRLDR